MIFFMLVRVGLVRKNTYYFNSEYEEQYCFTDVKLNFYIYCAIIVL